MYTVIIADDEYELRQSLVEAIDWERIGFQVVGSAANGMEALELIEELEPDLLLTDIKMPFISGIELARKVREIRPAMHIAFLSGYDDFAYAKEAIHYNIISYLLKPLSRDEIACELVAIRNKMDEQIAQIKSLKTKLRCEERAEIHRFSFIITLCMNEEQDSYNVDEREKEFEEMACSVGLFLKIDRNMRFIVLISRFLDEKGNNRTKLEHQNIVHTIANKYLCSVSVFINGKILSIVSGSLRNLNRYKEIFTKEIVQSAKKVLNESCVIGISRDFERLLSTRSAYLDAVTAWEYAREESESICFIQDMDQQAETECSAEYIREITLELERRLKMGQGLEEFLRSILKEREHRNRSFFMLQLVTAIYGVVQGFANDEVKAEIMREFTASGKINLNYTHEDIIRLAVKASDGLVRQRRQNSEIICEELMQIINRDYSNQELSLSGISASLHVSTGYLSTIVRKIQGETFSNLLTAKRMAAAKEYLFCTSKKVMEIANNCGYSDYHYFSYSFKKYYGVSPNKMRDKNKQYILEET